MLIFENSTDSCKTVERIVYTGFSPDLSTLFPGRSVEKPVENVDNSQIFSAAHRFSF